MNKQTQTLVIDGITCDACIKLITKRFSRIPGVTNVVSVERNGIATVNVEEKLPENVYAQALANTAYAIIEIK